MVLILQSAKAHHTKSKSLVHLEGAYRSIIAVFVSEVLSENRNPEVRLR